MSLKIQGGIVSIGTYNDHSREYNIDARGRDLSEVIRAIDTQDVVPVQEDTPQRREYCLYIFCKMCIFILDTPGGKEYTLLNLKKGRSSLI